MSSDYTALSHGSFQTLVLSILILTELGAYNIAEIIANFPLAQKVTFQAFVKKKKKF